MPVLCISLPRHLPRPGPRLRAVIVIVIYLAAVRLAPDASVPLALGGGLGGLLAIEPAQPLRAGGTPERAR
jgi:hypothetical protein